MTHDIDVLVIGAGPSGTVAAAILNKKGFKVKIVEKQKFPRFVIGESLLPRCMHNFEKAGFIEVIEQAGFQKKFGAKFVHNSEVCEFDFSVQFTEGWTWTWQVQRDKFDHLLAREIEKRGIEVAYEATVTNIDFSKEGKITTSITDAQGQPYKITSRFVIDASGYGRVLPRLLDLDKPSSFPVRTAIFSHVKPKRVPTGKERNQIIIVVYTKGVWSWVIPFADGTTSVGIVGELDGVNKFDGTQEERFRQWVQEIPALRERFTDCELLFEPRNISGYSSAVKQHFGKGYVLTGNSAEFIDPIFSSGVTFATESGALAAELAARELSGELVDWQGEYTDYIQRGVEVFKSFITHWYDGTLQKIFFSERENSSVREQICSVLAGYVWDLNNPMVTKHKRAIAALANILG
jgi:flavin-dependent dehydrogenase